MNNIDVVVGVLLLIALLRGFWRGFFRECCAFLGLVAGLVAAMQWTDLGAAAIEPYAKLPEPIHTGVAFVAIFAIVHSSISLVGSLLDRVASGRVVRSLNRLGGALVGMGKGAAVLAFVLLFLHLFPLLPSVDGEIMRSTIGRPLMSAAGDVLRLGSQGAAQPDLRSRT